MNALCTLCPIKYFCEDDEIIRVERLAYELAQQNSILRERLIENGLEAGASILATGEKHELKR